MAQVTADMETLDLRSSGQTPIRGRHVWKLQALLNAWLRSRDTPAHVEPPPPLDTDGIGGSKTRDATRGFQAAQQLVDDAVVGPQTWKALFEFDVERFG